MSKEVDSRIVEMQFDGKDFDKGIRKSQKNLEDFKGSLNFDAVASGFALLVGKMDEVSEKISLLTQNTKRMADEFTGFGRLSTYVAQKVKNAWHSALNEVENFMKSMTTAQEKVGSDKYDRLLKSVQTIKNATEESEEAVYSVMSRLNKYTDETSYNFSDMAQNIGKFTTAGIGLEDAEKEMEGIANWAALSGQGVQEAERAMYNISQAMSAGYMLRVDWKSIQNANMDTRKFRQEALEAAVAAGTLKKGIDGVYKTVKGGKEVNLDNFVETLQYKWFDKNTMESVFKTFADNTKGIGLEAYKAAQRCVTLNDAINAWKDMLSTGWMKTYEHIFGKLSDAMNLFSGLCNKVSESLAKLVDMRNNVLERWSIGGGRDALWAALFGELETPDGDTLFKGAYGLLDAIRDIGDAITEAFWDFVKNFIDPSELARWENDEGYKFNFLATRITLLGKTVQQFTQSIKDFLFEAKPGETETRMDRIKHIAEAIFAAITLVVNVIRGIGQFVGEILHQLSPAFYAIEQLIDGLVQMFTGEVVKGAKKNTIGKFFHTLAELLRPVTTVINFVVQALSSLIARVVVLIHQSGFVTMIGDAFRYLSGILTNLFTRAINSGVMQQIFGWIQTAISKIPNLVQKIKDLAKSFTETAKNSKALTSVKDFFKRIFGGKSVKDVLKNVKNTVVSLIKKIPELFASIKSSGIWNSISGFFSTIISKIFGIGEASAEANSSEITESLSEAVAKPIEELGKGDIISKAVDKAKPGFLANLKAKLSEIWGSITEFFSTLANSEAIQKIKGFFAGTTFKELISGATNILKWLAIFRTGSGLVSMGKGIKKLGTGIKVFGKNLKNLNLTNIFKDMFNISNVINSNNTDNSRSTNWGNFGKQLLMIAGAIGILVYAASEIIKMKPEDLKKAGISLAVLVGGLVAAGVAAKKLSGNGGSLLALAVGIMVLMVPLKIVQKMDWGQLLDGVLKLCGIVLLLASGLAIAGNVKAKGFIGLAVALSLILIPLTILMNMPLGDLTKGGGLIQGMLAIEALAFTMAIAARMTDGNKMKGMISLALALTILLIPIKVLAGMETGQAVQGVFAIATIVGAITAMIKITNGAKASKLAGIVDAIAMLAAIGWLIGHTMDWKQALIGFAPIILMIGAMSLMLREAAKVDSEKLAKVKAIFMAFSAAIVIISLAVVAMSVLNVDWKIIASFMGGLVLILTAMGVMLKLASKTDAKGIGKTALVLGSLIVLVAAVGGSLIAMSKLDVDWKLIALFMGGLVALIVAIGVIMPILGKMDFKQIIVGAAGLAAAVIAISGAVALMAPVVLGSIGSAMTTLGARLKTMSGLLKDFFDRMAEIDDGSLQHSVDVFESLKELLLKFSGFVGYEANIRSVMSQLNYLGAGLDMFFVNDGKYPDPDNSMSFKILNKFLEIGPSLAAFTIGSLPEQLTYMGVGLMLFNEATKGITTTDAPALGLLEGIFGQADNIEKFTKLPLEAFRSQMSGLGGAMSLYAKGAKEVTGLDVEGGEVPDITDSIGILKAVCNALSGEDGSEAFKIPENMPDEAKLGLFAGQLEALGGALSTFATAAHEMETDTSNATALLKFLAEIGGYVTTDNLDVVNVFDKAGLGGEGSKDGGGKLGQFALDIGALGTALSTFAQNIGGNESQFTTGLGVLDRFQELNQKLTKDNLEFTKVFLNAGIHKTALGTFSDDIGALGHSLASFAQNITMDDGTQADFDYALKSLGFLASLQNRLPDLGGLDQLIHGEKETLGRLSNDVQQLGQALKDFSDKMSGSVDEGKFDVDAVNDAFDFLTNLVRIVGILNTKVSDTDDVWAENYGEVLQGFTSLVIALDDIKTYGINGQSLFTKVAEFAKSASTAFNEVGGIDDKAIEAFRNLAEGIVAIATLDPSMNFEYPGQMIVEGIATGIEKGESRVVNAIVDVVLAAIDAGNETADMGSPSKVFAQMGEFMDQGLIKGLLGNKDKVENASSEMTESAIGSAASIMARISQAMAEDIDMQPTITPVLDLSKVTTAGATLDSFFSGYTLNLDAALSHASVAGTRSGPSEVIVQNPTDLSGVQGNIAALQSDIINLQNAIMNMKIVLNTGVVAGGVTDEVDVNLGMKNLYASRRN